MSIAERILVGARWSSAVICPRRAVYDYRHHQDPQSTPRRSTTRQERGWFFRGNAYADLATRQIAEQLAEQGVEHEVEKPVPWPVDDAIGTGHADIYIPSQRKVVEIHTCRGAELQPHKALQAAGYAINLDAREAEVLAIDPTVNQLDDENAFKVYPLNLDGLEAQVHEIEDQVYTGVVYDELPARCCDHPHAAKARTCAYRDHCFSDYIYPEPTIEETPDLVQAAKKLHAEEQALASLKQQREIVEARRDELRDQLRSRIPLGGEIAFQGAGTDLWLKRVEVKGRETLSLSAARAAGVDLEPLDAYITHSQPHERWYSKNKLAEREVKA